MTWRLTWINILSQNCTLLVETQLVRYLYDHAVTKIKAYHSGHYNSRHAISLVDD